MAYLQVLGGLALLVFAGDFLVRGAVSFAGRMGVPTLIIGLTIVAFGTSAPELLVGVDAVLQHAPTLALGNVIGSNIANIWLVLGVPTLIAPMMCNAAKINTNMAIMLAATLLFIVMAYMGGFGPIEGIILLVVLLAFLFFSSKQKDNKEIEQEICDDLGEAVKHPDSYTLSISLIIGGLIGLAYGAHLLVEGSVTIATGLGVSEAIIGLTLVALGTSIPELVTAIIAALKGHSDVAIGNVVGSNIFNILAIIGISSQFGEIPVPDDILSFDIWVMLAASASLLPFALLKCRIGKRAGLVFVILYGSYIFMLADSIIKTSAA